MKILFNPSRKSAAVDLPEWRSRLIQGFLLISLIILVARAVYLQALNKDFLQQQGQSRYLRVIEQNSQRGSIKDRNGEILAISAPVKSVWVDPQRVSATPEQIGQLADLLDVSKATVQERLSSDK
ncbi:MAG: penicillin-binding protein 2, partial [Nitrosomonas sp.]|nr:penicillin-binding protein 2 [Nitrosomonas sp.]